MDSSQTPRTKTPQPSQRPKARNQETGTQKAQSPWDGRSLEAHPLSLKMLGKGFLPALRSLVGIALEAIRRLKELVPAVVLLGPPVLLKGRVRVEGDPLDCPPDHLVLVSGEEGLGV